MRAVIDAHLDLAWSAMYFNRDLLGSVAEVRAAERGLTDELSRGRGTITFPELRRARVAVCLATVLARSGPDEERNRTALKRKDLDYVTPALAFGHGRGQLAYYRLLEEQGHVRFLRTGGELEAHWKAWSESPQSAPLGLILSMEGADPIVEPAQAEDWWNNGLRVVGPVHYGVGQYAHGTATEGPLTQKGVALLREFERLGMVLDVTHFSDESFRQALKLFSGPVLASHHNCRALVEDQRQLSDEQIRLLIERNAVVGTALDAWMLYPGWKRGVTDPGVVSLEDAADHIDYICQMAGTARHCALGTDLDGGFGTEQTPGDLDTYSDVHKLEEILGRRGYSSADIDGIFYLNWLEFFRRCLP